MTEPQMSEPQKVNTTEASDVEQSAPANVPTFRDRLNKLAARYQDNPRVKKFMSLPLVKQLAGTSWATRRPAEALLAGLLVFFMVTGFFVLLITVKSAPADIDEGFVKITALDESGRPESYEKIPYQLVRKIAGAAFQGAAVHVAEKSVAGSPADSVVQEMPVQTAEKPVTENPADAAVQGAAVHVAEKPVTGSPADTVVQGVPAAVTVKQESGYPKPGYTDGIHNLPEVPGFIQGEIRAAKATAPADTKPDISVEELMRMQPEIRHAETEKLLTEQPETSEAEPAFEGQSVEVKYSPHTAITVYVYSNLSTKIFLLPSEGEDVRAWLSDDKGWKVAILPDDIIRVQRSDTRKTQATDLFLLAGKRTYSLILQAVNNPSSRTDTLRYTEDPLSDQAGEKISSELSEMSDQATAKISSELSGQADQAGTKISSELSETAGQAGAKISSEITGTGIPALTQETTKPEALKPDE